MKPEDIEICKKANEIARADTLKHCKAVKLTPRRILKRIADGLDAKENKIFYDKDRWKCITGPDQINWNARQKAVDQGITILDMKPVEKREVSGSVTLNHEVSPAVQELFDKIYKKAG